MLLHKNVANRTFLEVQWLRLDAPNAEGMCSIPSQGTKIPHAAQCGKKKKVANTTVSVSSIVYYYYYCCCC